MSKTKELQAPEVKAEAVQPSPGGILVPETGKEVKLPSGKVAVFGDFKGHHLRKAQQLANGEQDKIIFAIIATTVTIEGKEIVMEDLDEMDGWDCLELYSQFSKGFSSVVSK